MSANTTQRPYLLVLLSQSQTEQGKLDAVEKQLREALTGRPTRPSRPPPQRRSAITISRKQDEDAFWEYLRVDVLYNQDREQQAKALFHLSTLFDTVKQEPLRANECKVRLRGKDFAGLDYAKHPHRERAGVGRGRIWMRYIPPLWVWATHPKRRHTPHSKRIAQL